MMVGIDYVIGAVMVNKSEIFASFNLGNFLNSTK